MAAAMTKTYRYPPSVAGGAVDPTAAQMIGHDRVVVDIASDAGNANESPVTVTHNMGLAKADGTDGTPEVFVSALVAGATQSGLSMAFNDANSLIFTKIVTGIAYTWRVVIKRPFSVGQ